MTQLEYENRFRLLSAYIETALAIGLGLAVIGIGFLIYLNIKGEQK